MAVAYRWLDTPNVTRCVHEIARGHHLAGEAGAAAFINKPFDKSDILSALDTALAGTR